VQELDVASEDNERTVLFLGRLEDVKGPVETLKAFIDTSRDVPDAVLVVAGDGTLLPQMQTLASKSKIADRISFLGAVNEKLAGELLKRAAILTAHSQKSSTTMQEETCGVAFLQAMAMGVPVVTGRSGGIPEYIVDGVNGFLFEPGDIAKHSYLLKSLLMSKSLRTSIGNNAKATIRQQFTREGELRSLVCQSDEV
jgi:glycosyltransferase involved in cell wall biosynthesis